MSNGSTTWSFTYDADGMRTARSNGSRTYSYVYNGSSLSQMTVDGHTLRFSYDASGTPVSVTYDGTEYYYVVNLQGDVVAILNGSGNTVVSQMPPASDTVTRGLCTVYLYTENADTEKLVMPKLVGSDAAAANVIATNLGLNVKIVGIKNTDAPLTVIEQSIPEGEKIKRGQVLILRFAELGFED